MELNLRGKTAIVTGGSRGLGKGISIDLAKHGVNLVINYGVNSKKAEAAKQEIEELYGITVLLVQADVSKETEVKDLFKAGIAKFGSIDILINNAGICPRTMIKDMELSQWQEVMAINVDGVFLNCREMVRHLINTSRTGTIVNITSQAAFMGSVTGKSHYSASKGAVHTFTMSLAKEVAEYGIRVNSLAPGMIHTELTEEIIRTDAERYKRTIPIGHIADPEEVAKMVTILASDVSSYMTGSCIGVNGGLCMR